MDIVEILLDAGDDPMSGLLGAIWGSYPEIVGLLLASGAAKNVNDDGGKALGIACSSGNLEIVKLILNAGADPLVCGSECMVTACRGGSTVFMDRSKAASTYFLVIQVVWKL